MSAIKNKTRLSLFIMMALLLGALGTGCGILFLGGAAGSIIIASDRRTLGAQTEDKTILLKASEILSHFKEAHINATAFNRRVLLTGEAPSPTIKQQAEERVKKIHNVREIINAIAIMGPSSLASRSNDTWLTSKVKTTLLTLKEVNSNSMKVVTERGKVYLFGLLESTQEGKIAADTASRVGGVQEVMTLYEYIPPSKTKK